MALLGHELSDRQTYADAIAVQRCERLPKSLHGGLPVSERAQSLSCRDEYFALFRFRTVRPSGCRLTALLRQLHISQCSIAVLQVRIGSREQCIDGGVLRGVFLRGFELVNRVVVPPLCK